MRRGTMSQAKMVERLKAFDLTVSVLQQAAKAGHVMMMSASPHDAPFIPGTMAWAWTLRTLRDLACADPKKRWRYENPGGFSITINDRRRIVLVVATGDENTGVEGLLQPKTKTPKGARTIAAIAANTTQDLFPDTLGAPAAPLADYTFWWLLVRFTPDRIYSELSCAERMEGDVIVGWSERILLPEIAPDPERLEVRNEDFADDFDPEVKRRA